jgi:hypothetical protein
MRADTARVDVEPVIYRNEAVGMMFTLTTILEEVETIRAALLQEDDGEEEVQEDLE